VHLFKDYSVLRILLICSAGIIIVNYLVGIACPTLILIDDEMSYLDTLWRTVVGQRASIDYHNPMGFGPYQVAALLWHLIGPHDFLMRVAITLVSLLISFCGCIVAHRVLAQRIDLALLFCVTLAFQLSTPTVLGYEKSALSIVAFYNRHIVSALAVLFLQTFAGQVKPSPRDSALEVGIAAVLLNVLFVTKISGFLLGLMILFAGWLLQPQTGKRILQYTAILVAFVVITAVELRLTGLEISPIIGDYELAAHARSSSISFHDILTNMSAYPLMGSVTLLVLFALSSCSQLHFWQVGVVIVSYTACQLALNLTNNPPASSIELAPAAMASLTVCMSAQSLAQAQVASKIWLQRFSRSGLAETSLRDALPFAVFVLVLIPQVIASITGILIGALVSLGLVGSSIVVTAGNEIGFRSLVDWPNKNSPDYLRSLNDAVAAITALHLDHQAIANLDFVNPFPVLFLAPPPKGIQVWWDFGFNVPRDSVPEWQNIIGDACVVTVPMLPISPDASTRLVRIAKPILESEFTRIYDDELWNIYLRTRNCATAAK
jgi:hypothetical protein